MYWEQIFFLLFASLLWGCTVFYAWFGVRVLLNEYINWNTGDLIERAEALDLDRATIQNAIQCWIVVSVMVCCALFFMFQQTLVSFCLLWLAYKVPRLAMERVNAWRAQKIRDQMVPATVALANTARAGLSVPQGLQAIGRDLNRPLATIMERIANQYQGGRTLETALDETRNRLKLEPFTLFSNAVQVSLARGGKLTESLDRISRSLQEHQRLERKMLADTANGRRTVQILAAFPFLFLLLLQYVDPKMTSVLFTTLKGQIALALTLLLVYAGVRKSFQIMDLKV